MSATPLVIVAGALAAAAAFLIVFALGHRGQAAAETLEQRVEEFRLGGMPPAEEEELRQPLSNRVLRPLLRRLGQLALLRTKDTTREKLLVDIRMAGRPFGLTVADFMAVRGVLAMLLAVAGLAAALALLAPALLWAVVLVPGGALLGYLAPRYWLSQRVKARRTQIEKELPDGLDLLTVCVEAGLGFEAAMAEVAEKGGGGALAAEFGRALSNIRLGMGRFEALELMGKESGVVELHDFCQGVVQSERLGVGLATILRVQSDDLRERRRERTREQAARAGLKMLLPMVGCIFPTIWIVLLGPAVLTVIRSLTG